MRNPAVEDAVGLKTEGFVSKRLENMNITTKDNNQEDCCYLFFRNVGRFYSPGVDIAASANV